MPSSTPQSSRLLLPRSVTCSTIPVLNRKTFSLRRANVGGINSGEQNDHSTYSRITDYPDQSFFSGDVQYRTWKHIADAKGYVLINLFSLLHSEMKKAESSLDIQTEQKHLKIMAVGCLAFCCCREKQMGKTFSFDRYTDAVRSAYKPHRDTGNSEEQREVLQKKIASLEKEFGKSISLSFTEMKRQIDAVISLAVECLMLCATVECEQLEQLEQLEQGLALGLE